MLGVDEIKSVVHMLRKAFIFFDKLGGLNCVAALLRRASGVSCKEKGGRFGGKGGEKGNKSKGNKRLKLVCTTDYYNVSA